MTQDQEKKLIEIIKEIVAAQYREMGELWCATTSNKLNAILIQLNHE
jgi:hypothetical protein